MKGETVIYLVGYDRPRGSACVGGNDDAAIVEAADNGGSGGGRFGERNSASVEGEVPVVVAEVEARHRGDGVEED